MPARPFEILYDGSVQYLIISGCLWYALLQTNVRMYVFFNFLTLSLLNKWKERWKIQGVGNSFCGACHFEDVDKLQLITTFFVLFFYVVWRTHNSKLHCRWFLNCRNGEFALYKNLYITSTLCCLPAWWAVIRRLLKHDLPFAPCTNFLTGLPILQKKEVFWFVWHRSGRILQFDDN